MLKTYLEKTGQDDEAELMKSFSERLTLNNNSVGNNNNNNNSDMESSVKELLASLTALNLKKESGNWSIGDVVSQLALSPSCNHQILIKFIIWLRKKPTHFQINFSTDAITKKKQPCQTFFYPSEIVFRHPIDGSSNPQKTWPVSFVAKQSTPNSLFHTAWTEF